LFYFLYHVNGSFLFDDGFKKTISRFPSLIEIASKELAQIDENKYHLITTQIEAFQAKYENINAEKRGEKHEEDIIELIGDLFGKDFRQVHKYIAIVQADGDKIGQMVTKVGTDPDKIQNFSQKLMEYSRAATDIVVKYGGSPVYMGGDDLFFFAPMTYRIGIKKTHILEMINDLDLKFKEIITFYAKDKLLIKDSELPSLSFGISFSYYKFPLYEAKNLAFSALFEEIKWVDKRNAIKVKFRKHSGQLMELFVNKNKPELWNETIKFISQNIEINAEFLNSFTHKLRLQEDVLFEKIASDKFKLEFFFRNNFNENYNQYSDYFSTIISFIHSINAFVDHKEKKTYLYSVLRFIHFLRS
jgi:CRISPR-associated protein Cmr2